VHLSNEIVTAPADSIRDSGSHLFWAGEPLPWLARSIGQLGQAQPVLVHETHSGLALIAGHARLTVLRSLGLPVLARLVVDPGPVDLGLIYLADNALRPLDDAMRLAALQYFAPLLDRPALAADILPRLGVNPESKDARLLLAWLDLPAIWQAHLAAGRAPLAAATVLARMTEADRDAVAPLFTDHSWSRSNAVNLLTWLFEASKMTGKPVAQVMLDANMADPAIRNLSPKDAMARLVAQAKNGRYPSLSALEARFESTAREMTAGTSWRIAQPDNFETNGVELSIRIKDPDQLAKAVRDLKAMANRPQWPRLWNPEANHE